MSRHSGSETERLWCEPAGMGSPRDMVCGAKLKRQVGFLESRLYSILGMLTRLVCALLYRETSSGPEAALGASV